MSNNTKDIITAYGSVYKQLLVDNRLALNKGIEKIKLNQVSFVSTFLI